jgi:ubiquinone/menaquinone biosynthesis C-methylase UbiE
MTEKRIIEKHFSDTAGIWKSSIYKHKNSQGVFEYFDKQYRFDYVVNMIPKVKQSGSRALDMGCGAGQLIPILKTIGYDPYGMDISEEMIKLSKDRCSNNYINAHLETGDCEKLQYPDNYFDVYIAMGVIEYMDSDRPMLSEIKRVLKPGGIAIVTLRNKRCIPVKFNTFYKAKIQPNIRNFIKKIRGREKIKFIAISKQHDPRKFLKLLSDYSLNILDDQYCHYHILPYPLSQWLFPIRALAGKLMEKIYQDSNSPFIASTYIVKFQKQL